MWQFTFSLLVYRNTSFLLIFIGTECDLCCKFSLVFSKIVTFCFSFVSYVCKFIHLSSTWISFPIFWLFSSFTPFLKLLLHVLSLFVYILEILTFWQLYTLHLFPQSVCLCLWYLFSHEKFKNHCGQPAMLKRSLIAQSYISVLTPF